RSAYVEAITLLKQGLGLLSTVPEGADRDACELLLQVPLGVSYMNTRGYAAPEVGTTFQRAHQLSQRRSDKAQLFRVLRGVWNFAVQRADLRKARAVAEDLLRVAERQCDPAVLVEAHRVLATTWSLKPCAPLPKPQGRIGALQRAKDPRQQPSLFASPPAVPRNSIHRVRRETVVPYQTGAGITGERVGKLYPLPGRHSPECSYTTRQGAPAAEARTHHGRLLRAQSRAGRVPA